MLLRKYSKALSQGHLIHWATINQNSHCLKLHCKILNPFATNVRLLSDDDFFKKFAAVDNKLDYGQMEDYIINFPFIQPLFMKKKNVSSMAKILEYLLNYG